LGGGGPGLIGGVILGDVGAVLRLGWSSLAQSGRVFRTCFQWAELKRQAWEYREFAIYGTPQNVMNALSQGLPVLILAFYYGAAVAGWYAFGMRLLQVPMNFILLSMRQVLFQKLSQISSSGGDIHGPFVKSTQLLVFMCLVPATVGFLVAPPVFAFIFGEEWRVAGEYSRWLILWLAPMFCNVPATLVARILRLQRDLFLLDVFLLGARAAVLVLGGMWLQPLHTIIALSAVGTFFNIGFIWYVARRVQTSRGTGSPNSP
jgi:O-antigen/teichoic acid export membrane protein